jgi:hypothetical protein
MNICTIFNINQSILGWILGRKFGQIFTYKYLQQDVFYLFWRWMKQFSISNDHTKGKRINFYFIHLIFFFSLCFNFNSSLTPKRLFCVAFVYVYIVINFYDIYH